MRKICIDDRCSWVIELVLGMGRKQDGTMKPVARRTLADEAAETLKAAIREGRITGALPGTRSLCQSLGISLAVLTPALQKLREEGWLSSPGTRRRYLTHVVDEGQPVQSPQTRKVWVLEAVERVQPGIFADLLWQPLEKRLHKLGWTMEMSTVIVDQARRHDRLWNQMLDLRGPDALLLWAPCRTTAEWAARCGVPACAIGGDAHGLPLSLVGIDSTFMVEAAVERLLALGHREICLLMSARTPGWVEKMHATMERLLARQGINFVPAWHAPVALHNTPAGINELLERRFKLGMPSALLVFGSRSLEPVTGFFLHHGIAVPRDVSLVMLGERRDIEWIIPPVASFDFPWTSMLDHLMRWISTSHKSAQEYEQVSLKPQWIEGSTIAPYQRS